MDICAFLAKHDISYERFDHPAVFTCEESARLCPPMPGAHTKNLFLRDDKGRRHFLVSVPHGKSVDLKGLGALLGVKGLGFASPDQLKKFLGVEPGAVTLLGLVHDYTHAVEAIIDTDLWNADRLGCHPLVNTATLVIPREGVARFLVTSGHTPRIVSIPSRVGTT